MPACLTDIMVANLDYCPCQLTVIFGNNRPEGLLALPVIRF